MFWFCVCVHEGFSHILETKDKDFTYLTHSLYLTESRKQNSPHVERNIHFAASRKTLSSDCLKGFIRITI